MSVIQIPNLGPAIALNGTEQFEAVQAGTSVRVTTAQLGAYVASTYPAPGVSSIATSAPITGGTITSTGTIGLATAGITNTYLAAMSAKTIKANITTGSAQPTDATVTSVLDTIGSASGSLLYRGASAWSALAIGGSNYVLTSNGSAPSWQNPSSLISLTVGSTPIASGTNGYILYNNGSVLGNLATTGSGNVVLSTSPTLVTPNLGTPSSLTLTNATGLPLGSGVTGTLPIANGGTGQVTASAAFNALSPITSTGDLIIGNGASSATRLGIGTTGYVLTSNGTTATWAPASSASSVTIGTTAINSGTSGRILYDNAGVFGELATTGSGNVVLATSPTLVTPNLGTPSAATLTNATGLPLSTGVTGTLGPTNGGTGLAAYTTGDTLYASATNTLSRLSIGSTGQVLTVVGGLPAWGSVSSVAVTSFSAGTTGLTPASPTAGAIVLAGTLAIANGGTGQTTASAAFNALSPITSTGDLIIGNGVNSATRLAIGTNGYVLTSNGTTASWAALSSSGVTSFSAGTTGLTPSSPTTGAIVLAGTLGATNGGTAQSAYTTGDILYASATNTLSKLPIGSTGQVLTVAAGIPSWAASTGGVTSFSGGTTGLTPSSPTTGAITLAGTLATTNGGTGLTSFTSGGAVYATSTSALTTGTLPVASGGTGVTSSSGANSVVLRDANANVTANNFLSGFTSTAASGSTITLTVASTPNYVITGSGGQTIKLPDATTLPNGIVFTFNNNQSSGTIVVQNNSGTTITTVQSGGFETVILLSNSIATGTWDYHPNPPANASWSTNTLSWAGSYTSGTWNGNAIGAIYGGTAQTSYATGDTLYASASNTLSKLSIGSTGQVLTVVSGAPAWAAAPAALLTVGTTTIASGTTARVLYDNGGVLGEYAISGTGSVAMTTSPSFTTPTLGAASATTINKVTITAPATGSTLTIADGKTATISNTLTFTGTDGSSVAFGAGGTVLYSGSVVNQSTTGPTTQNFTSGTAATYTTPAGVKWIKVRMVGGGGGGGGVGSTTGPTGGTGGTSIFNSVTAVGGSGGTGGNPTAGGTGGIGGTGGTGTATLRLTGSNGSGSAAPGVTAGMAGAGASTPFGGGAGAVAVPSGATNGIAAAANTGSGGGGAVSPTVTQPAGGGGASEYVEIIIINPAGTYTYTVGAAGAGGIGTGTGVATGGPGAAGLITVEEHYNY